MAKKKSNNRNLIIGLIVGVVVFALAMTFFLLKDSGQEQIVTYERRENGIIMSLTYYAKGDRVYKQTAKNVIPYSAVGASSKDEAKTMFDAAIEANSGVEGYEDKVIYYDDHVVELVMIDYNVVDKDEVQDLIGNYFSGDINNGISLSKSIKRLEDAGFSKVENGQ